MGQKDWLDIMSKQTQIRQVLDTNGYTEKYGLVLCAEEAELLAEERVNVLKSERRIEFGQGILPKIIYAFCDPCLYHPGRLLRYITETAGDLLSV